MTQEEAERLDDLVNNGSPAEQYEVRYTGGPYVNSFGRIYTNDDGQLCYADGTYAEMILVNCHRRYFSVFLPLINWWEKPPESKQWRETTKPPMRACPNCGGISKHHPTCGT
jgi:hypothetical protein